MTYTLDFRRRWLPRILWPNAGQFSCAGQKITPQQMADAVRSLHGIMMVCGYNSSANGAEKSYRVIESGLKAVGAWGYDFVIHVQWPTSTGPGYWHAEAKVYYDGIRALSWIKGIGDRLRERLRELPFASLDIVAHSLGNGVVLDALKDGGGVAGVRNLILTNPAVEDESICAGNTFAPSVTNIGGKALVFFSRNDDVLRDAFALAHFGNAALGYSGPQAGLEVPSTVVPVDASAWCYGHSAARDRVEYYRVIQKISAGTCVQ